MEDRFYLSGHLLYGSSRLGVKTYLPGEYQYYWNNGQSVAQNNARMDSSDVAYRMPWYSDGLQSLIKYNGPVPYGYGQEDALWSSRIVGQKRYELTNHLGNVMGVVSDKVTEVASGNTKVERATLKAAYDYYPLGMLMPGRHTADTARHYVTMNQVVMVPHNGRQALKVPVWKDMVSGGGRTVVEWRFVGVGGLGEGEVYGQGQIVRLLSPCHKDKKLLMCAF